VTNPNHLSQRATARAGTTHLPCIFCRELDVPRTTEHVLQKALNAASTLPTAVCGGASGRCNDAFSPIDKTFVDFVLSYHTGSVARLLRQGFHRDPGSDLVLAARIADGLLTFAPQIFRRKNGVWTYYGPPHVDPAILFAELGDPGTISLSTKVAASAEGEVALAVIRSSAGNYLVQGPSPDSVASLESAIHAGMFAQAVSLNRGSDERTDPPGAVEYQLNIDLGAVARASAKIALNFVCKHFGAETALKAAFDPLRRFARYGEGTWHEFVTPTLLNGNLAAAAPGFAAADRHTIMLQQVPLGGGFQIVVPIFVSGELVAKVLLLPTPIGEPLLPLGTWRVSYFYPESRTVDDFCVPEDGFKCFANPEAVGIPASWAATTPAR